MTDTETNVPSAPVEAPASAPVASATAPLAPSAPESSTAIPSPQEAPASVVSDNAPATEAVVAPVVTEPTLFGDADKPVEAAADTVEGDDKKPEVADDKPADDKVAEDKSSEEKPVETEVTELPKYEAFKLPENFEADEKSLTQFSGLLGELESAKGDHVKTQELGQKLIDLATSTMQEQVTRLQDYYVTLHNQEKQKYADDLKKDPYFGANGDAAGQSKIKLEMGNFLRKNLDKTQLNDFAKFVDQKGIGDALPLARIINTFKEKIERYENENSRMLPGTKPSPSAPSHPGKGVISKMYGKN